jgi:hypothetical protein
VIFPVCKVAASADLIRKMGGGGFLGRRCIARCLLTPSTPMLLFIYCFSFHPFLKIITKNNNALTYFS